MPHLNYLVGLLARPSHETRFDNILTVAEHPPEGVARKRSWGRFLPRQDHPRVQSSSQGHPDLLLTVEVPREIPREGVPELPIIGTRLHRSLVLPLPRLEVRALLFD